MKYEDFLKVILTLQKANQEISKLNDLNIDLINFVDPYQEIISTLIKSIYGEEGLSWFEWYCYESDFGERDWSKGDTYLKKDDGTMELIYKRGEKKAGAYDDRNNPICFSHESTWEYLEKNHKIINY